MKVSKTYICIDFKTFFASVECVERGLNPFTTNLVVADPTRGNGAICLAVSPKMKEMGVRNRCRIFEIPNNIKYITALPRMKKYIEYAANIYAIYLKYIAKEDIHVYSIDESFMDVTKYLKMYKLTAKQLSQKILDDIFKTTGISASVGIGTNMFLTKVALDILAKHASNNIAYLDEDLYKERLWNHKPLTDFWQIGRGISKRLEKYNIFDMEGITKIDQEVLYKEFGVNAEYLIDHAWGREPCTISQIKAYRPVANSLSTNQILFSDYKFDQALLVLKEMVDLMCLQLVEKNLVSDNIFLSIGYSKDIIKSTGGSVHMTVKTNSHLLILPYFIDLFNKTTSKKYLIRRIAIGFNNVISDEYEQFDLFTDYESVAKEKKIQKTINLIKNKYGKNSIVKAMDLEEDATTIKRNKLVGGHNAE
ncbi:MAG: DNA repair protein [Bacilli bacterium]|nr:DNA repair protein [Bacilli bacterium]MDD2682310.1 DNA repair protein [Bacilli bacterium]MDD3121104.1 DNA repair protein [Bacilli bacterium]MDD4063401.1 DNA repair protein [Bacilli bacterium]MDD4482354.1 DNA repair protein [Bacilli bacterium]